MKKILAFLILIFFLFISIHIAQKKGKELDIMDFNGYWWEELTLPERLAFLKGYMFCAHQASDDFFIIYLGLTDQEGLKKKLPGLFIQLESAIERYNLSKVTMGQFISGIDEIYSNSENTRIPVTFFIQQMADYIQGEDTEQDLEEWLKTCRQMISK